MPGFNQQIGRGAEIPHDQDLLNETEEAFWAAANVHWPKQMER